MRQAASHYPAARYTGKHFISRMAREAVPYVIIESENETRKNIIALDESTIGNIVSECPVPN